MIRSSLNQALLILIGLFGSLPLSTVVLGQSSNPKQTSLPRNEIIHSGPLLGFSHQHEVKIWLRVRQVGVVSIEYWPIGSNTERLTTPLHASLQDPMIYTVTLSHLTDGTHYNYRILFNGTPVQSPYPLTFQTQPRWQRISPPPNFNVAIGSCAYWNQNSDETYGGNQAIYEQIRAKKPDIMLWLGDNLYLRPEDWNSHEGIFRRYASSRANPALQPLLGSVHHYATWDDHDYGPNDANRSYALKGSSLLAFKTFWANPSYGLPELPGVFGQFSWGDVDFFLLDDRTYRAPASTPEPRPYLGQAQLTWLLESLSNSRAPFKVIASGSQVLSPYNRFESYAQHPTELHQLISGLKARRIEGVIFLSGDRHHAELNLLNDDPQFYPLYDFTSSPLTSGIARSSHHEAGNPRRVSGTFITDTRNFGMLRFSGPKDDRQLRLEAYDALGVLRWSHTINAKSLTVPNPPQD